MFFTFPEDARWNAERQAVEFGVEIGEYRGVVRVPRRVFQRLLPERLRPNDALKPTTSSGPGSRASPSGSCVGGSWPRTGMSRLAGWTCGKPRRQVHLCLPRSPQFKPKPIEAAEKAVARVRTV
jgi:hypothetical protein